MKTDHQVSAGGLVVRGDEVLLISTSGGRRWQLPKGRVEPGETPPEAAVREVREETGVSGEIVAELPEIEYWFVERREVRVHKRVHYYLLSYVAGDCADFDRREVSGAAWLPWEEAVARLSFDNERQVVAEARRLHERAPAPGDRGPASNPG